MPSPALAHGGDDRLDLLVGQGLVHGDRNLLPIVRRLSLEVVPLAAEHTVAIDAPVHDRGGDAALGQPSDEILAPLRQNGEQPAGVRAVALLARQAPARAP